jgi:hypothetical protein
MPALGYHHGLPCSSYRRPLLVAANPLSASLFLCSYMPHSACHPFDYGYCVPAIMLPTHPRSLRHRADAAATAA